MAQERLNVLAVPSIYSNCRHSVIQVENNPIVCVVTVHHNLPDPSVLIEIVLS
jgi:hypothetical protein